MRKSIDLVNQMDEPEPSAEDLFEAIHGVMHRYRARQYRVQRDSAHELTHMDGKVLGFFARHPGATQKDLVEHAQRDKGQLARLIAGLRERGLLDGQPDAADRRNIRLQLTAEGRAVQRALQRQARLVSERAVASLSSDERRRLAALLHKLHAAIAEAD